MWLPLPTFLAAIPMAIAGTTFGVAQVSSVLMGSLVPVLGWRLAADVAEERDLSPGRARTLALGAGLTCAVYLPLLLHSALPDSTMPFAVLALTACLVMARVARDPEHAGAIDPRLVAIGALIGLAALTRNEAVWLGLTWAIVAWGAAGHAGGAGFGSSASPAIVAVLVFAPWAIRDWAVFGSPLPGQAAANAFSVTGFDIFAWNDPPTLARYLAVGPARLLEMRVEGLGHNLFSVLLLVGPADLPARTPGPPLAGSRPGAAAGPAAEHHHVPVHEPGLPGRDDLGHVPPRVRARSTCSSWSRRCSRSTPGSPASGRGSAGPVPWPGSDRRSASSARSCSRSCSCPRSGRARARPRSSSTSSRRRMAAAGAPLDRSAGPVITDFPIWLSDATGVDALALPDEPAADVLDLARAFPGTRYVVVMGEHGRWPAAADGGDAAARCFRELDLGAASPGLDPDPLADTRAFEVVCP